MSVETEANVDKRFDVPLAMQPVSVSEDVEKEMHLKELRNLAQNMEQDEFEVLVDYIPIHLILKRIEREINEKVEIEDRIEQMHKDFIEKG